MKTECPHCKGRFTVKDEYVGKSGRCPRCRGVFTMQAVVETVTAKSPAAPAAVAPPGGLPGQVPMPSATAPPAAGAADIRGGGYASPMLRAMATTALLAGCILVAAIVIWSARMQLGLLERAADGEQISRTEKEANDSREALVFLASAAAGIAAFAVYLSWKHRAYSNLSALGTDRTRFSPAGSVAWYFCPIANLWKPYQAMMDIVRGSAPETSLIAKNSAIFVGVWWLLCWVCIVAGIVSRGMGMRAKGSELVLPSKVVIVSSIVTILSGVLTIVLVWSLSRSQVKRAKVLSSAATGSDNTDESARD